MENWVNGTVREINETDSTLYYSQQSKDPLIADCEPTILYSHAKVSTYNGLPILTGVSRSNCQRADLIPYEK